MRTRAMLLLVGLGNPGRKYAATRHNIGWRCLDSIAQYYGIEGQQKRWQSVFAKGVIDGQKVGLLYPQTFMNLSGQAVAQAISYLNCTAQQIIVFHDDLDLAAGKLRVRKDGGHAGHRGVRSLIQHIGADFVRVRIGVGRPPANIDGTNYVLQAFSQEEERIWVAPLLTAIARECKSLLRGDYSSFMNRIVIATQEKDNNSQTNANLT